MQDKKHINVAEVEEDPRDAMSDSESEKEYLLGITPPPIHPHPSLLTVPSTGLPPRPHLLFGTGRIPLRLRHGGRVWSHAQNP